MKTKIKTIVTKEYEVTNEILNNKIVKVSNLQEAKKLQAYFNLLKVCQDNKMLKELTIDSSYEVLIDLKNDLALDAVLEALQVYKKASKASTAKLKKIKK